MILERLLQERNYKEFDKTVSKFLEIKKQMLESEQREKDARLEVAKQRQLEVSTRQ